MPLTDGLTQVRSSAIDKSRQGVWRRGKDRRSVKGGRREQRVRERTEGSEIERATRNGMQRKNGGIFTEVQENNIVVRLLRVGTREEHDSSRNSIVCSRGPETRTELDPVCVRSVRRRNNIPEKGGDHDVRSFSVGLGRC
jgi:hypothetical protein